MDPVSFCLPLDHTLASPLDVILGTSYHVKCSKDVGM